MRDAAQFRTRDHSTRDAAQLRTRRCSTGEAPQGLMEASPGGMEVEDSKVQEVGEKMEVAVEENKKRDEDGKKDRVVGAVEDGDKDEFENEMDSSEPLGADARMKTRRTRRTRETRRQD